MHWSWLSGSWLLDEINISSRVVLLWWWDREFFRFEWLVGNRSNHSHWILLPFSEENFNVWAILNVERRTSANWLNVVHARLSFFKANYVDCSVILIGVEVNDFVWTACWSSVRAHQLSIRSASVWLRASPKNLFTGSCVSHEHETISVWVLLSFLCFCGRIVTSISKFKVKIIIPSLFSAAHSISSLKETSGCRILIVCYNEPRLLALPAEVVSWGYAFSTWRVDIILSLCTFEELSLRVLFRDIINDVDIVLCSDLRYKKKRDSTEKVFHFLISYLNLYLKL